MRLAGEGAGAELYDDDGPWALFKEIPASRSFLHLRNFSRSFSFGSTTGVAVVVVAVVVVTDVVTDVVTLAEVVVVVGGTTPVETGPLVQVIRMGGIEESVDELYPAGRHSSKGTGSRNRGRRSQGPT